MSPAKCLKLQLDDRLRHSSLVRTGKGLLHLARSRLGGDAPRRLFELAEAYRFLIGSPLEAVAAGALAPWVTEPGRAAIWRERKIGWERFPDSGRRPLIHNGLILKPPLPGGERGVMLISFEKTLLDLMACKDFDGLCRRYTLILATSVSPPPFYLLYALAGLPGADIYFMGSNQADQGPLAHPGSGAKVLPQLISEFINPDRYAPLPADQRDIDILMVAIWARAKRHHVFFRALKKITRPLKVVLVGQPDQGWTLETIKRQAAACGVLERLEFLEDLPIEQVRRLQCRAKSTMVFSRREGACVVNAESLFADAPVGLIQGAHLGSARYINPRTGVFFTPRDLPGQMLAFLDGLGRFDPRAWALEHISHTVTLAALEDRLTAAAAAAGRPWTRGLELIEYAAGYPVYSFDAGHLAPAYQELYDRHQLEFTAFVAPNRSRA